MDGAELGMRLPACACQTFAESNNTACAYHAILGDTHAEPYHYPFLFAAVEALIVLLLLQHKLQAQPQQVKDALQTLCGTKNPYQDLEKRQGSRRVHLYLSGVFLLASGALLYIGLGTGFLCDADLTPLAEVRSLLKLPLVLFMPGFVEEFFWRKVLLPYPRQSGLIPGEWSRWEVLALVGFIVYHVDLMHSYPRQVFSDVRFLLMAAVLGVACTEAYLVSGSIFLGVVWHGLWVWSWLCAFSLQ